MRRPELLKSASFSELVLLFAEKVHFTCFLQNPKEDPRRILDVIGTDMQKLLDLEKKHCKASGNKQGEILVTLGQRLWNVGTELAQSAEQREHQSEKSKGEQEDERVKVEGGKDIFKNMVGNCLKLFEK